jgi:hypothetical protein
MNITTTIAVVLALVLTVSISLGLAHAQTNSTNPYNIDFPAIDKMTNYLEKIGHFSVECANASKVDTSTIPICMPVIHAFNAHMEKLYNEQRANITKIMIGGG